MPTATRTPRNFRMPAALGEHLRAWAGALPNEGPLCVVTHDRNAQPGWDGRAPLVTGLVDRWARADVLRPPVEVAA